MFNYVGQLRLYSAVDLLLLLCATRSSVLGSVSALLLWFGFLIYLEWRHRDRGRSRWHPAWWLGLWLAGLGLAQNLAGVLVVVAAIIYSQKKTFPFGAFSCVANGLLKVCLVYVATDGKVSLDILLLVLVLTTVRNLCGDLRDVAKDAQEHVVTLPVLLRGKHDVKWAYPVALAITSLVWALLGELPIVVLAVVYAVQYATYEWTAR